MSPGSVRQSVKVFALTALTALAVSVQGESAVTYLLV